MASPFTLDKQIWTDADFEYMGWHDSTIHASSVDDEYRFLLDIDYIFEWVHPKSGEKYFKYWIAPCTLIIENVYNLVFDLEISAPHHRKIDNISRANPSRPVNAEYIDKEVEYSWKIETLLGEITFQSVGFKQHVRRHPVLNRHDELGLASRGGISFGTEFTV